MTEERNGNILRQQVRLFDLTAGAERLYRLSYPSQWLVPVEITSDEETATYTYNMEGLRPATELFKAPLPERLRFLANVAGVFALGEEYALVLSPENLYVDRNLVPKVLFRDLLREDSGADLMEAYRALAGAPATACCWAITIP